MTLTPLPASTGAVTCINSERRWVFIKDDSRPQEIFLPRKEWRGTEAEWQSLRIGDRLRYRLAGNRRYPDRLLAVLAVPDAGEPWSDAPMEIRPEELLTGRVVSCRWPERPYGFVREDHTGREIYFQMIEVPEDLRGRIESGARICFRLEEDLARPGRICAVSVRPAAA